jgi:hypothetical protein
LKSSALENIEMDHREMWCEVINWIFLAQRRVQWRIYVNTASRREFCCIHLCGEEPTRLHALVENSSFLYEESKTCHITYEYCTYVTNLEILNYSKTFALSSDDNVLALLPNVVGKEP